MTWHYLSIATEASSHIVRWPAARLHLLSPRVDCEWTLFSGIEGDGRYVVEDLVRENDDDEAVEPLLDIEKRGGNRGRAVLRPYDGELIYCNGHILCTDGVVGTVGGPPIGLYPNPKCPQCGLLMFHVLTVEHRVRPYGDGFRSLFVCESCEKTACNATPWN